MTARELTHALTIDVEDYFHVSAFARDIAPDDWSKLEPRVVANTHRLLDLLAAGSVRATFFVLGWVAERQPQLVRAIVRAGHELASHGYSHQLIYDQSPEQFKQETLRGKQLLEDIGGTRVAGYRAASYSITPRSLWALDTLAEAGFEWDSSIFPVRHDRYGIPDAPRVPHRAELPSGQHLVEFPLTTYRLLGTQLPAIGGGYFRLYPYALSSALARGYVRQTGKPFVFYMHPWEIDPEQPRIATRSWLSRFRHYNNLDRCAARLARLMEEFAFGAMSDVLHADAGDGLPVHRYSPA